MESSQRMLFDSTLLSVTELTRQLKELVEANFPEVQVTGEISNLTRAASGHVYFTLKDQDAQLRAVAWRGTASRLRFDLHDGLEVVATGGVEVYAARGSYQLIVRDLQPRGMGALELAFRQLQEKLSAEGLFAPDRKRPIPRLPRRIALVTSPTGAAVRDMLQVITRRWPPADIVILPVAVQGEGAARQIAGALNMVGSIPDVDVVITGRGGGSLEDLWAFNEEIVARAIAACTVPVIAAVGHETDVSIADLVADRRALTPSEAGELVVPRLSDVVMGLNAARDRMVSALKRRARSARVELSAISHRSVFRRPYQRVFELANQLDELDGRMRRAMRRQLGHARQRLGQQAETMEAFSPLKVLQRGYSMTTRQSDSMIVKRCSEVSVGDELVTRLADGKIISRVESTDDA